MPLTVLKPKGWTFVPVASANLAIDQIRVDGKPANVVTRDGWHSLVFDAAGAHEIKFTLATSVVRSANVQSLNFPLPTSTQTSLDLTFPQEDLSVELENAVDVATQVAEKATRVTGRLPAQAQLSARWQKALPAPEKREPRVTAKVFNLVSVSHDSLNVEAFVIYSLLHAAVEKFLAPKDAVVEQVTGDNVHSWQVNNEEQGNRVVVQLKAAARNGYSLQVSLRGALVAEKPAAIPIVEPQGLNATAHGEIAVESAKDAELSADDAKNAIKIDTREVDPWLFGRSSRRLALAYSYARAPEIRLSVTRHQVVPVLPTVIDPAVYSSTFTLDGQRVTKAQFFVRNNESQYLARAIARRGARVERHRQRRRRQTGDGQERLAARAAGEVAVFDRRRSRAAQRTETPEAVVSTAATEVARSHEG
jgi:hypothetical protein